MANAGFGLPINWTFGAHNTAVDLPWENTGNDEPGLVFSDSNVTNNGRRSMRFQLDREISGECFFCTLGLPDDVEVYIRTYANQADYDADTSLTIEDFASEFSTNHTATSRKFFMLFTPAAPTKWFRVDFYNRSGATSTMYAWRVLVGEWIEPADNIEIRASSNVDDRQKRQYAVTGRRNFFNAGVYPVFQGKWPWLTLDEYRTKIRPMSMKYGSSIPVVFCLDYEDTDWGEDELYYGDLEKEHAVGHEDGNLYSYAFTIVDIAQVD